MTARLHGPADSPDEPGRDEVGVALAACYRLLLEQRHRRLAGQDTQDETADPVLTLAGQTGPAAGALLSLADQEAGV